MPLSARARETLAEAREYAPGPEWVFPSPRGLQLKDLDFSSLFKALGIAAVPHGSRARTIAGHGVRRREAAFQKGGDPGRGSASVRADQGVHIRQSCACAPGGCSPANTHSFLCRWMSCGCGSAAQPRWSLGKSGATPGGRGPACENAQCPTPARDRQIEGSLPHPLERSGRAVEA